MLLRLPVRDEKERNRFLVGALVVLASFFVPVLPLVIVSGYRLRLMRQAISGDDLTLPDWDDWGELLKDGLAAMVVGLVYLLPGMLVLSGGMGLYFIFAFSMPLVMAIAEDGPVMMAMPVLFLIALAIMFLSMMLGTVLSILGAVPVPVATARWVEQKRFGAAFQIRKVFALQRANALGYLIAWVVAVGLFGLVYLAFWIAYASIVLCCLIPILLAPLGFYLSLVSAGLFGRAYREGLILSHGEDAAHADSPTT
jgi:hypothetical protein